MGYTLSMYNTFIKASLIWLIICKSDSGILARDKHRRNNNMKLKKEFGNPNRYFSGKSQ